MFWESRFVLLDVPWCDTTLQQRNAFIMGLKARVGVMTYEAIVGQLTMVYSVPSEFMYVRREYAEALLCELTVRQSVPDVVVLTGSSVDVPPMECTIVDPMVVIQEKMVHEIVRVIVRVGNKVVDMTVRMGQLPYVYGQFFSTSRDSHVKIQSCTRNVIGICARIDQDPTRVSIFGRVLSLVNEVDFTVPAVESVVAEFGDLLVSFDRMNIWKACHQGVTAGALTREGGVALAGSQGRRILHVALNRAVDLELTKKLAPFAPSYVFTTMAEDGVESLFAGSWDEAVDLIGKESPFSLFIVPRQLIEKLCLVSRVFGYGEIYVGILDLDSLSDLTAEQVSYVFSGPFFPVEPRSHPVRGQLGRGEGWEFSTFPLVYQDPKPSDFDWADSIRLAMDPVRIVRRLWSFLKELEQDEQAIVMEFLPNKHFLSTDWDEARWCRWFSGVGPSVSMFTYLRDNLSDAGMEDILPQLIDIFIWSNNAYNAEGSCPWSERLLLGLMKMVPLCILWILWYDSDLFVSHENTKVRHSFDQRRGVRVLKDQIDHMEDERLHLPDVFEPHRLERDLSLMTYGKQDQRYTYRERRWYVLRSDGVVLLSDNRIIRGWASPKFSDVMRTPHPFVGRPMLMEGVEHETPKTLPLGPFILLPQEY